MEALFELNSFQEGWLNGLGITKIEEIKYFLITEQIKRWVPTEIREHFIDSWAWYKNPETLVKELDGYDTIRSVIKKLWNVRPPVERKFERPRTGRRPEAKLNWCDKNENKENGRIFEKPRKNIYFL